MPRGQTLNRRDLLNKYPVLSNDYILRLERFGGILINIKTLDMYFLDEVATVLYSYASGIYNLNQIAHKISELQEDIPIDQILDKLTEFVFKRSSEGKILLLDEPKKLRQDLEPINTPDIFNEKPLDYLSAPLWLTIHLTDKCNLSCIHCYLRANNNASTELPLGVVLRLVKDSHELKIPFIIYSGGEPLLYNSLEEVLKYHNELVWPRAIIASNLYELKNEHISMFKRYDVFNIHTSVDGLEKTHDIFRGVRGAFKTTIRNIKKLIEDDVNVHVGITLTNKNAGELENIIEFLYGIGVRSISITPLLPAGRGLYIYRAYAPTPREILNSIKLAVSLQKRYSDMKIVMQGLLGPYLLTYLRMKGDPKYFRYMSTINNSRNLGEIPFVNPLDGCSVGSRALSISPNGDVYPCIMMDGYTTMKLGNVYHSKLLEIWTNSPTLNKLRHMKLSDLHEPCRSCPLLPVCRGGCRASALWTFHDLYAPDPRCPRCSVR